jgi:hypothetical protein
VEDEATLDDIQKALSVGRSTLLFEQVTAQKEALEHGLNTSLLLRMLATVRIHPFLIVCDMKYAVLYCIMRLHTYN